MRYFEFEPNISHYVRFCEILRQIRIFICLFHWIHKNPQRHTPFHETPQIHISSSESRVVANMTADMSRRLCKFHTFKSSTKLRHFSSITGCETNFQTNMIIDLISSRMSLPGAAIATSSKTLKNSMSRHIILMN